MGISPCSFRTIARPGLGLVLAAAAFVAVFAIPSAAQNKGSCPEIIASLLPKSGAIRGGTYSASGPMGMGGGAADLPFEHPCVKSTKYPARVSISVTYYGGEMVELLKMQGDSADQQTILSATSELEKSKNPVKTENLAGGQIVYWDDKSECPAEGAAGSGTVNRPPIPNIRLRGVARTSNARLEITLEGQISTDLAKAAVAEVFENLKKADFEKAK